MKFKIFKALRIFLLGFLALLLLTSVLSTIEIEECICRCQNTDIKATGVKEKCKDSCGRACGGLTDCSSDCENCCTKWCSGLDRQAMGSFSENTGCLASCKSTCELKKTVNEIISAILVASGIVAAIMIVIHGIRILTAQDPSARDEAKKGILFVIFALAIIGIAGALVNLLMGKIILPGEEPTLPGAPTTTSPEGCANSEIKVEVTQINYADTQFDFKIKNKGNRPCRYLINIYDINRKKIFGFTDEIPVDSGGIGEKTRHYMGHLDGGYSIEISEIMNPDIILYQKWYRCGEECITGGATCLEFDPSKPENPKIDGNNIRFYLNVINPSKIRCDYTVELLDKNNAPTGAKRTRAVCTTDCKEGDEGEWKTELSTNINNLKGEYNIVLSTTGREVARLHGAVTSQKARELIEKIGKAVIDCWNSAQPNVEKVCWGEGGSHGSGFDITSMDDTDVITEEDIRDYVKSQPGMSRLYIAFLDTNIIKRSDVAICIKYETRYPSGINIAVKKYPPPDGCKVTN